MGREKKKRKPIEKSKKKKRKKTLKANQWTKTFQVLYSGRRRGEKVAASERKEQDLNQTTKKKTALNASQGISQISIERARAAWRSVDKKFKSE